MSSLTYRSTFTDMAAADIHADAQRRAQEGWRYVQTLAVNKDGGVDLVYAYMDMGAGELVNLVVSDVAHNGTVVSITDVFFEAFVFENEIHDLFGISFDGLKLDFGGNFYRLATDKPMTVISSEQLAEREKQRKIAAAKAVKAAKAKAQASPEASGEESASANDADDMEAKLTGMDPEKAAKVRAAMKAKAAKAAKAAKEAAQASVASAESIENDVIEVEDGKGAEQHV